MEQVHTLGELTKNGSGQETGLDPKQRHMGKMGKHKP